jgi:hypothetical protein
MEQTNLALYLDALFSIAVHGFECTASEDKGVRPRRDDLSRKLDLVERDSEIQLSRRLASKMQDEHTIRIRRE